MLYTYIYILGCFFCPQYLQICVKPSHILWESHSSMYAKFGEDRIRITYGTVLYKSELIIMTLLCVHQIINGLDLVAVIRVRSRGLLFTGRHFKPLQLLHQQIFRFVRNRHDSLYKYAYACTNSRKFVNKLAPINLHTTNASMITTVPLTTQQSLHSNNIFYKVYLIYYIDI